MQLWLVRKDPAYYGPIFNVEPLPLEHFPWERISKGWVRK